MHLAQGVDQFDNRIGSHTSRRTGKNKLQRAKGTGFIVLQSGRRRPESLSVFRTVAAGESDFFLFGELNRQFAVDPVLYIEEGIIQHRLGCLRVSVDFTHERFNLTEFRRISSRTGIGFTDPAGSGAAKVNQFFIVGTANSDSCGLPGASLLHLSED